MSHISVVFCAFGALVALYVVLYVVAATLEARELDKKNPTRGHRTAGGEKSHARSER
jgi:hypothetical protein